MRKILPSTSEVRRYISLRRYISFPERFVMFCMCWRSRRSSTQLVPRPNYRVCKRNTIFTKMSRNRRAARSVAPLRRPYCSQPPSPTTEPSSRQERNTMFTKISLNRRDARSAAALVGRAYCSQPPSPTTEPSSRQDIIVVRCANVSQLLRQGRPRRTLRHSRPPPIVPDDTTTSGYYY